MIAKRCIADNMQGRGKSRFLELASACILFLSAILAGCAQPKGVSLFDEAFAIVYPELASSMLHVFPSALTRHSGTADTPQKFLPFPISITTFNIRPKSVVLASPEVAIALSSTENAVSNSIIDLLIQQPGHFAVLWESEGAYFEMGLLAGYRTGFLRSSSKPSATAALLFSRGVLRAESEINAFESAFNQGMNIAGSGEYAQNDVLSIFNVEVMGFQGDKLEQTFTAHAQMMDKHPDVVMLATGSREVLERTIGKVQDVLIDSRGLGAKIPKDTLFAEIEENDSAIVSATKALVNEINAGLTTPKTVLVKPKIYMSPRAKSFQKKIH
jgi:hypothetical protein